MDWALIAIPLWVGVTSWLSRNISWLASLRMAYHVQAAMKLIPTLFCRSKIDRDAPTTKQPFIGRRPRSETAIRQRKRRTAGQHNSQRPPIHGLQSQGPSFHDVGALSPQLRSRAHYVLPLLTPAPLPVDQKPSSRCSPLHKNSQPSTSFTKYLRRLRNGHYI